MTILTSPAKRLRLAAAAVVLLIVSILSAPVFGDPAPPDAEDRHIAVAVRTLLRRDHLTRHPLDDEIAQRCLKTFLEALDPWKLYFYQSDVDQFRLRQNELDDLARNEPKRFLEFAHMVFGVLLERIDEKAGWVEGLLAMEHDFTIDEEIVRDRELTQYAQSEAEARERWRKWIKFDLLLLKADGLEPEKAVEKLRKRYRARFRGMHQTDSDELLETYLSALTTAFDPHTTYMSRRTLENFEIVMRLQLEGIGAALQSVDGQTVVKRIIPGGAADKDGRLKVEDIVVGVGQGKEGEGEIEDVVEMKLSDVVEQIRGKAGTWVRLEVTSSDNPDRRIIDIKRAKIELTDAEAQSVIFQEGQKDDGTPFKIGVINLPSFYMDMEGNRRGVPEYRSTTRDVRRILEQFKDDSVDAVILDLRRNGGGSLQEAINLTGLFINDGPIVQVKDADGNILPYPDPDKGTVWDRPLVVLISKLSASASEILAGAIQDYRRGLVVGDRATHGKGTVQSLMDIGQQYTRFPLNAPNLGALKITMQQFYRPSGDSTQNRGVLADIELPSLTTHLDVGEADLDYPIAFDRVAPLEFQKYDYVDEAIRDRLRYLSSQRCKQSEGFQEELEDIDRYLARKKQKSVTLNEAKFLAEMKESSADEKEKETIEGLNEPSDATIERDYYLDEALAITLDYLQLMMVAVTN